MQNKLTNILPGERLQTLKRGYFLRLATIAITITALLVATYGILRTPSYIYLQSRSAVLQQTLTELSTQLSTQDIKNTNTQLKQLESNTTFLTKLATEPSASFALESVLGIARKGVTLSSMTYTAISKTHSNKITLSGVAQTRNSLQHYQELFKDAPFITSVNLPVNVYSKDANIKFTMTLTGKAQTP